MPIFYDENYRLVQTYIKSFPANAMEHRDLTRVYFEKEKEVEKMEEVELKNYFWIFLKFVVALVL